MRSVGAHEVLVENPRHDRQLWNAGDAEIEQFLLLAAHRVQDLSAIRASSTSVSSKTMATLQARSRIIPLRN
jgi:galactose-1-phosphate uridylyltransferase